MSNDKVIIGTRGSDLALWQANETARLLGSHTELKIIKTSGDRFQDISLQGQAVQGFFTKEIEKRLLDGDIDVAVHSLKDLPTQLVQGLSIGACLKRAAVSDLLVVNSEWHAPDRLIPLSPGTRIGAMSLRRQALLKHYDPECSPMMIRGNVPGRIQRCRDGEFGAVILARAGVERLGLALEDLHVYEFNSEYWPPAPGQGVVAVEARSSDSRVLGLLSEINDSEAEQAAELERRILANFEGGCHTAFGAWATQGDGQWKLLIGIEDSGKWLQTIAEGSYQELSKIGPGSTHEFTAPAVSDREELCQSIQL